MQDMDELETVQKTNAKICSNATALVDEAEEELGKIDGWLVISLALVSLSPSAPSPLFRISLSPFFGSRTRGNNSKKRTPTLSYA